jgi:hypothetical protein
VAGCGLDTSFVGYNGIVCLVNLNGKVNSEKLDIDGRIILESILKK